MAGTQSGKTSFGPWWLSREIERGGPGDYLAVTSSYDLFKLKLLPEMRTVFEHLLRRGRYWSGDRIIEIADPSGKFLASRADDPMWARIILRSAAADSGLESSTALAALLDECGQDEFTVETWEAILRRLSLSQGRVLGTTTPYNVGWLKTEIFDHRNDDDFEVIQFPSYQNPAFPPAEYERARRTMQAHRFKLFYRGEFGKPPGLIYEAFNDDDIARGGHLVEPFAIPPEWPRYVGVDFGGANTALLWIAENPLKRVFYAYRESLSGGKSTREHAAEFAAASVAANVSQVWGGAPGETQQRADWTVEGVPAQPPPIADVEAGIDRGVGLFAQKRMYVFSTMTGLRDELGTYRRKLDDKGQPTDEIIDKRKFHRLDAYRYVASGLADGVGVSIAFEV